MISIADQRPETQSIATIVQYPITRRPTGMSRAEALVCVRDHAEGEIIMAILNDEFTIDTTGYAEVPAVTIRSAGLRIGETLLVALVGPDRTCWGWTAFIEGVRWRDPSGRRILGSPEFACQREALGQVVRGIALRRRWCRRGSMPLTAPATSLAA